MGTRWLIEDTVDPRWPIYTRGNVGEVFPDVATPLNYHLLALPHERAWRKAMIEMGPGVETDFARPEPTIVGVFAGYAYLNLSYLRILGVRAPGSSADAVDATFFSEGNPPAYERQRGDRNVRASVRVLREVLQALNTRETPKQVHDSFDRVARLEARAPSLDAPADELFDFVDSFAPEYEPIYGNHMMTSGTAAITAGILTEAAVAAGEPGLVTHLIGAAGDVRSAQYAPAMYELALLADDSSATEAEFERGIPALSDRLAALTDEPFNVAFADFLAEHGHRGPNDWDIAGRTWENTPELALSAIDAMRNADHDLSPAGRLADDDAKRQAAIARVRPHLKRKDRTPFDKAIEAAPFWAQGREATRDRAVRALNPLKRTYRELVRRAAERGGHPDPARVALLTVGELRAYVAEPATLLDTIAERAVLHDRYAAVEPPFFITSQADVPTLEQMEADQRAPSPTADVGDVLAGVAGSSGIASGKVRVIMDPAAAHELEPGEVLVAPITDPAWTPLFLPSAAVVVNVGSLMSHAVIVARELAIPCAVSVSDATARLETGMTVEVDGTAGTVTVLEGA